MSREKPTKEQMQIYEDIRASGMTNMFDIDYVIALSNGILTPEVCYYIMADNNYMDCMEEYGITRKN